MSDKRVSVIIDQVSDDRYEVTGILYSDAMAVGGTEGRDGRVTTLEEALERARLLLESRTAKDHLHEAIPKREREWFD